MDTTTDFNYMVMTPYTNHQHHVLKESLPEKKILSLLVIL